MTNKNPWQGMSSSTQRRVDSSSKHNIYWVTDLECKYGLYVQSNLTFDNFGKNIHLKGISVLRRNSDQGMGELFLVLSNKEEWEIFYKLCLDLIVVAMTHISDDEMIFAVENRLRKWQRLLQKEINTDMTIEKQMGLFSELSCLLDVVSLKTGIRQAIISWVGPDADKQDFLLDNAILEIKSYRTSKGETVNISSLGQLLSENKSLFLLSYALTFSDNGISIADLVKNVIEKIVQESDELILLFNGKLIEYGYLPELQKKPLFKFIIDPVNCYNVSSGFPRILREDVDSRIKYVKYFIDLNQCKEWKVNLSKIFTDGGNND